MISANDFGAIKGTSALNNFYQSNGAPITTQVSSISFGAIPNDFLAVRNAVTQVRLGGGTQQISPQSGAGGVESFNDRVVYGNIEVSFSGSATALPSGGVLLQGIFTSPGDDYDSNLSWFDSNPNNDRGAGAEALTAILAAMEFTEQGSPYRINVDGALNYGLVYDSSGVLKKADSTVSTVVAGQTLTLNLSEIRSGESFAEAFLRKQAANGGAEEKAEYEKFKDGEQTTGYLDAVKELATKDFCFLAGTPISMWDGSRKPIEKVKIGDVVVSYDDEGDLKPGTVSGTLRNKKKLILDFHGLMVTPGHVVLCGDGANEGLHLPIIEILKSDGAIVREDGTMVRAATEEVVGSRGDAFVHCLYATKAEHVREGLRYEGKMRVGTRLLKPDGTSVSVLDCIEAEGMSFDAETGLVCAPGEVPHPLDYFGELPKPEAYVLKRSKLTMAQIYAEGEWEEIGAPSQSVMTLQ